MHFLRILPIIAFLLLTFCKESVKPLTLQDDKVYAEIQKEIAALEADKKILRERNDSVNNKIKEMPLSSKFVELLKKQRFTNVKLIELIDQNINYKKIRSIERERYFMDNQVRLKIEDLDKQYEEYMMDLKANPPSAPWKRKLAKLPGDKKAADKPTEKKEEGGGGHH